VVCVGYREGGVVGGFWWGWCGTRVGFWCFGGLNRVARLFAFLSVARSLRRGLKGWGCDDRSRGLVGWWVSLDRVVGVLSEARGLVLWLCGVVGIGEIVVSRRCASWIICGLECHGDCLILYIWDITGSHICLIVLAP